MIEQLEQHEEPKPSRALAPEGFGYDWRGRLVDLRGLRRGEDGPPIFLSKLAKGET
jgi:hypothetical protein